MPAPEGSFAWTEDARFLSVHVFSPSVLKTVTASEKYLGGPGWESASAAFAWGGSPGPGQRGRETRSAEEGTKERRGSPGAWPPGGTGRSRGAGQRANAGAEPRER